MLEVKAAEVDKSKEIIEISHDVKVGDKTTTLKAKVAYKLEEVVDSEEIDYYYIDVQDSEYGIAIETSQAYGFLPATELYKANT